MYISVYTEQILTLLKADFESVKHNLVGFHKHNVL